MRVHLTALVSFTSQTSAIKQASAPEGPREPFDGSGILKEVGKAIWQASVMAILPGGRTLFTGSYFVDRTRYVRAKELILISMLRLASDIELAQVWQVLWLYL